MKKKETNYVECPPPDMEAINKALKQAEANRERKMEQETLPPRELDAQIIVECVDSHLIVWDSDKKRQLWSSGRIEAGAWERVFDALTSAIDKEGM